MTTQAMPVRNSRATAAFTTIQDALRHVRGERMLHTSVELNTDGGRMAWPPNGTFIVKMTGLPEDGRELAKAIHGMFEAIDPQGFVDFPVSAVHVDYRLDEIRVVGDESRAKLMWPMPG